VAGLTVLFIAAAVAYRVFEDELMRFAMVPKGEFREVPLPAGASYDRAEMWIARPDLRPNPALWAPPGFAPAPSPRASVFFIHPTSFLESSGWNAPLDDAESQTRARLFVRSQASAFNSVGEIWAPKYRQAAFGAFLTTQANARRALDFAYRDVLAAYEAFLRQAPSAPGAERPADHPRRPQPGQPSPAQAARGADQGRTRGGADRGGLCRRLAGVRNRRSPGAAAARL